MASLRIRGIDKAVLERLKVRASLHGVPLEEEVLEILCHAAASPDRLSASVELDLPSGSPRDSPGPR